MVNGLENIEIADEYGVGPGMEVQEKVDLQVDQALTDDGSNLYNRQHSLGISTPEKVSVIGVGGVGCWVAFDFALIGAKNITLIDDDKVDVTNLNRTMFKSGHIGQYKTLAMKELILERRPHCNVITYNRKYEDIPESAQRSVVGSVVIDCRDSIKPLDKIKCPITGGYNGLSATIHVLPDFRHVFGEENSPYTIIPSYVVVPQMIAGMIVNHVCVENRKGIKEMVLNIDFKKLLKEFEKKPARKRSSKKEGDEA